MNKVSTKIQQNMSVVGNIGKFFEKKEFHPATLPRASANFGSPQEGNLRFFIIGITPYAGIYRPFRALKRDCIVLPPFKNGGYNL
jgi:hypothetical protein